MPSAFTALLDNTLPEALTRFTYKPPALLPVPSTFPSVRPSASSYTLPLMDSDPKFIVIVAAVLCTPAASTTLNVKLALVMPSFGSKVSFVGS